MRNQSIKIIVTGLMIGLFSGCATNADLDALKSDIAQLQANLSTTDNTAKQALAGVQEASASAQRAESSANAAAEAAKSAEQASWATSEKLDRMFKRSMMK
jgi:outer membrane murein-binding lipoprotein Lpp